MKKARVAILVLAVAAAGGAIVLASGPKPQKVTAENIAAPVPVAVQTDDVLVAAREMPIGNIVAPDDMAWQSWPKDDVAPLMIKKSDNDKVVADLTGSIVRANILQGEPIRRERLIKGANAGFLSAILPSGMRAVAINIDAQGSTSAGGFILPNDRVDVIRTTKLDNPRDPSGGFLSETLLSNVRVLAIGQNVQDKNGQSVVVGSNATLELDPVQAETIILGQRTGQLSLVLRSMLDASDTGHVTKLADKSTTIVRYGVQTESSTR